MNQPGWQKVADLLSVVLRAARWEDEDGGLSTVDRLMEVERKVCHLGDRLGGLGLMGSGTADTVVAGGEMPVRAVMVERGISTESAEGAEGDVNGLQRLGEEMSALREQVVMQQVLLDDGMEAVVEQVWQMFLRKEGDGTGQLLRRVEGCEANFHVSMVRFQARLTAMELQMQALEQRDAETGQADGAGRHGEIIGGGRERGRR